MIHTHPSQPQMQAEVILASKADTLAPVVSIRVRCPRIIWAEVMTHRVFSRNARSSRAVPIETMLAEIKTIPFVPWHWGKNQKGMQADVECNARVGAWRGYDVDFEGSSRQEAWLSARDKAVESAMGFAEAGYHKQVVNRLVEPFMWIDALITANQWDNFFELRDHPMAEPHFQDLAALMRKAIAESPVQVLTGGQWHLPYIDRKRDVPLAFNHLTQTNRAIPAEGEVDAVLKMVSAARCARISYAPFDGRGDFKSEIARFEGLVAAPPIHASPVEHQCTPDFQGWPHLHGNLPGWVQFRKLLENQYA